MRKIFCCFGLMLGFFMAVNAQSPNIILVVTDDQGMEMLGCYGDKNAVTPNIDKLAAEGIKFNRAYCTTPSCSPSRSVILTGLHNHKNGQYGLGHSVYHFRTHESVKSLPVLLSSAGYYTMHTGKLHVYPKELYKFDASIETGANNPVKMVANFKEMMAQKPVDKPFFLYFATTDPHHAIGPNKSLPYAPNRFGNIDVGHEGVNELIYDPEKIKVPFYLPDIPEAKAELAQYYQSIHRVDEGMGAMVKFLKEKGLYDNTIIIYTSDNGAPFAGAKGNLYDAGVRLPFVVKTLKNGPKNKTTDAFVAFTDITPTILDLAGVYKQSIERMKESAAKDWTWEYPSTDTAFHGKSIKPILEDKAKEVQNEVYLSHSFHELYQFYPMRAVVTNQYKFIWNLAHPLQKSKYRGRGESIMDAAIFNKKLENFGTRKVKDIEKRPEFELYDLKNDPQEAKNLAYDKAYEALLNEYKAKIWAFQKNTGDSFYKMNEE